MKKLWNLLTGLAIYMVAIGSVFAAGDGVAPIKPDQTDIKFIPYPKDDLPENIAKGTSESVWLRPVNPADVVYYRILSVEGADQTSPISESDTKVEKQTFAGGVTDCEPIQLTEALVNADGQFVVKAAALRTDGTWSENVIAAYNVVFGEHVSATVLAFVTGEPTELMVGESYEMQLSLTAPPDSLARYGNANVSLFINMEGGIGFADVQYKFAASDAWTSVDPDDLDDLIRIPNTFKNFAEKGVWVKLVMSRKKWSDEMWLMLGIAQGNSFLDGKAVSSVIDMTLPCFDRPAAMPAFSPAAGYIDKGSTVTISCATSNTSIYYTTDGTEPTQTTGTLYESPLVINGLTTIKALAVTADGGTSFISEAVYSVVGIPQITPEPAPYTSLAVYDSLVEITLSPETDGASIYYTTDGTEPTATTGTLYTGRFPLRADVLKAVAVKDADYSPVVTVEYRLRPAPPTATPAPVRQNNKTIPVPYGTKVKLECITEGAQIYWRIGGNSAVTTKDNLYTGEIELKDASTILKAVAIYKGTESQQVSFTYTVTLAAPEFSIPSGVVPEGARVMLSSKSVEANTNPNKQVNIAYTLDGTEPTKENVKSLPRYTGAIEITEAVTIKAMTWTVWTQGLEVSEMSTATYTVESVPPVVPDPVELTFNPAPGSEVEENTEVTITANQEVEIFYMMFESEDAAKAAEWNQEDALSYSDELKPVLSAEKNTLKVAYALEGAEELAEGFIYATYTVKELPAIELTFNPAPGSEVEDNTEVTVTAIREVEIFYNLYADKAAADADTTFMATAKEVQEDGKPVITKAAPYLRCGVTDKGGMKYFDAAYTVKEVANEGEELMGVMVYPNPSNGLFNIELPVSATVEVFASNGALCHRMKLSAGNATLNIERSGIYFFRITGEGRTAVKRVVVR